MTHYKHLMKIGGLISALTAKKNDIMMIVCAAAAAITLSACSNLDEIKTTFLKNGESYFKKGDYFMARMQFKQALRIDPGMEDAYYDLGITETQLGNIKQALSNFLRVLAINPNHSQTHVQIGQIMLEAGFPQKAIQKADRVLSIDEKDDAALKLKATALLQLEKSPDQAKAAANILEQLLRAGNRSAEIYYYSAKALLLQSQLKSAQVKISEGLAQNPDSPMLYELLASTYQRQGEKKGAIRTYQKLTAMAPTNPDYLFELVELLWQDNQKEKAQELLAKRILTVGAKDASVWVRLSQFYARKNKPELSQNTLIAGLQPHPDSFKIRLALARMLIDKGQYIAVIKRLYPALNKTQTKPGFDLGDAQLLLSKSFLAMGELTAANKYAELYLRNHPQSPDAHFVKGTIHLLNNDPHSAASEFWTILAIDVSHTAARIQLAHAMTRTDQWQEALKILSAGLERNRQDTALRYALFQTHLRINNQAEAEAQLKELLSQNPNDLKAMTTLANFYKFIGARDKAIEKYDGIIRKDPKSPTAYLELSRIYTKENKLDMAIEQLMNGLAAIPDSDQLLKALVNLQIQRGSKAAAVNAAKARLAAMPQSYWAYVLLGDAYTALRKYDKAEKAYFEALNLEADSSEGYSRLMDLWYRQDKKNRITDFFHSKLTERPNAVGPRIVLAGFYLKEESRSEVSKLFKFKPKSDPHNWRDTIKWIRFICNYSQKKEDIASALDLAKELLQFQPDTPMVLATLGWAYFNNSALDRAQGYLFRALDLNPDLSVALYDLAKVSINADRHKTAQYALERFLASDEEIAGKNEARKMLSELRSKE